MFHMFDCVTRTFKLEMSFKCVELNKTDNKMFYYVCVGGQMVKDANESSEYKGG